MTSAISRAIPSLLLMTVCISLPAFGQGTAVGACRFAVQSMQFRGTPAEQTSCLLRRVAKWGKVSQSGTKLPLDFAAMIGQPTGNITAALRSVLAKEGINEASVGGALDASLSRAYGGKQSAPMARYFVIHDTSSPYLGNAESFPPDDSKTVNNLSVYARNSPEAHVYVNRLGATIVPNDFSIPSRATKLENKVIGRPSKGLFLHIELVQPRRRDPAGGPRNDALAPDPGFTPAQYDKLALLYIAASARAKVWLIPAFHAAIDDGLAGAHDDPQNFELPKFIDAVMVWQAKTRN